MRHPALHRTLQSALFPMRHPMHQAAPLLPLAALSLATCSAAFSISGLTAIFAGATGPVVGLGIAFEIGKLSAVARLRLLPAHSSDGDQWFQTIVITVSSDRDQAQHELFTVLSIGAAAVLLLLAATADKRRMEGA
jgi:hypothetical protein